MPRDAPCCVMMQLLLATFLLVCALAELRLWNRSTFKGEESSSPVRRPADRASTRHLQDCEVIGWAELCERKKLTAGSCFRLEPTAEAPLCELQGPHGAPAQLLPAAAGILTLTSGKLRFTGRIQMTSLRLAAKTVNFADAHVEAWHEVPSDPNFTESGGAFFSEASFTLTRSRLTVRGSAAADGGGFAAGGDLNVRQDSEVVIEHVAAKSGAGFHVKGNVYISDNSTIFIQNARSIKNGGGFSAGKHLRVFNSSVSLQNVTAGGSGGGFTALGDVEIAGHSTVHISNIQAESGDGGGFRTDKGLKVSTGSRLIIRNATAGRHGGGFYAKGKTLISRSTVSIQDARAQQNGGGFSAADEVVIDEMSSVSISNSRSTWGGGFHTDKRLQVTNSSAVSLQKVIAQNFGGGFNAIGDVEIAGNSTVHISHSRAELKNGGGFDTEKGLRVYTGSRLIIRNATAGIYGGGFFVGGKTLISRSTVSIQDARAQQSGGGFGSTDDVVIDEMSRVSISNSRSAEQGGGFRSDGHLQVTNSSLLSLENVTAAGHGGGFFVWEEVVIAGNSTVNISNSHTETRKGGGFLAEKGLKVSTGSRLTIRNATAGKSGGGFYATGKTLISNSTVSIENTTARQLGGGFSAVDEVVFDEMSTLIISNSRSGWGGGFHTDERLQVTNSSTVSLQKVIAQNFGGGFNAIGEVEIAGNSTVNISNSRAELKSGGGFYANGLKSTGSRLIIQNATAGKHGGGFYAKGKTLISRSTVGIQDARAQQNGGGFSAAEVVIDEMSSVSISNSRSGWGGGFDTDGRLQVTNSSAVSLQNVTAQNFGGGFNALGEVEITGNSTVNISNSHAAAKDGGGFATAKGLKVSTGSRLIIRNATAGRYGGGFDARARTLISRSTVGIQDATAQQHGGGFCAAGEVVIDEMSSVSISNSRSGWGGGFHSDERLQVTNSSVVILQNITAQNYGGGFNALGGVEIAGNSTVNISNSRVELNNGGGFDTEKGLKLSAGSRLIIGNATAGKHGGGFYAKGKILISRSTIGIQDARAHYGGGFSAEGMAVIEASTVAMFSTHAGADGGAFSVPRLSLHRSSVSVSNSSAVGSGSAGRVDGQVLLLSHSKLVVKDAQGLDNSTALAASCLHLRDRSHILFEDVIGGHGVELSGCSANCSNSTFHVAEDAALNASGRLSSGLLSLAACPKEKVRLSGIHLHSWSSSLLSTRPSSVVVDQVTIDYEPPVNNLQVIAAKDGFEIDSLTVSCANCTRGVTFNATKDGALKAVSSEYLQCPKTVTASNGLTQRCKCSNYQIAAERFRGVDMVPLENVFQTCMFCQSHFHYQNGDCTKCGIFNAWSVGKKDVCHVLPREKTELLTLLTGGAVVVVLIFIAFEILHAPLRIVDAKSNLDPSQAERKTIFTFSVQGPIVDLPKNLSRLVNRRVRFRARGTGLIWLDYDHKKSNTFKVRSIARRKLLLQDTNPPFLCATCKGSLHTADFVYLLGTLTVCILAGAMLPAILKVAIISGNGVGHVFVTAIYVTLPLVAAAALLHFPVAWVIQRLYRRTSFSEALDEYRKQINCKPLTGPEATHPRNQGLQVLTLRGMWIHFESFILERNMHFVVANIVKPLTHNEGVSFVTLWGGRRVDYFVSHSWGTSFPHFVHSIQCHALSKEGPTSWIDAAYWICSFANNQWNIGAELGSDPMESAFARTLTAGIKGVAMVLDQEVQPLTRVWCLFEFLLSSRQRLELVFVTNAGVIGDDGCSSFDIALEVGKKIESLQVANCGASSEKDKKDIFDYIVSELGSLEHMDEQIRELMGEMLVRNLANVEQATDGLLHRLGRK